MIIEIQYLLACLILCPFDASGQAPPLVLTEHIDFTYLRLYHLLDGIPRDISRLRQLLKVELNNSVPYREAWTEGVKIFKKRKLALLNGVDARMPQEYHVALIAYTSHDVPETAPFYGGFNTATRNLCTGIQLDAFSFKSFFQLLRLAVQSLAGISRFSNTAGTLYRGVSVRYSFKVGSQVAFQQYTSLSQNRSVAELYSKNVTLLIFKKMAGVRTGMSLKYHSKFPGEAEILMSPLQVYRVRSVGKREKNGMDTFTLEPIADRQAKFKYFTIKYSDV